MMRAVLSLIVLSIITGKTISDTKILVAKSGTIADEKANGKWWDIIGVSAPEPFVKIRVYDTSKKQVDYGETDYKRDTYTPVWNTEMANVAIGDLIKIEVWDKDLKFDDVIGKYTFRLTKKQWDSGAFILKFGQVNEIRFQLRKNSCSSKRADDEYMYCSLPAPPPIVDVQMIQAYPPRRSQLRRSSGETTAVILLQGLDLCYQKGSPAIPQFQQWQGSTSAMVKSLAKSADVFSLSYAQTMPVEKLAKSANLRNEIAQVVQLGYKRVVVLGHSAGGVLARHIVEDDPKIGVNLVIQVATPNGGCSLAHIGKLDPQLHRLQRIFVESFTPCHRTTLLAARKKRIPKHVEFVVVVCGRTPNATSDRLIAIDSQWTRDLQLQGIPCVFTQAGHGEVMIHDRCIDVLAKLAAGRHERWDRSQVFAMRKKLGLIE